MNTRQRLSFSFPELRYSLLKFNSRHFAASIWRIERDGISARKFEAARFSFFKWRFRVTIAFVFKLSNREFLHRRRRRQREHHFKNEFQFFITLSRLFQFVENVEWREFPWSWFIWDLLYRFGKWKTNSSSLFYVYSMERKIRHFHVVVVQWQPEIYKKRVMHVQSCFFAQ